jgi:histidine triad (HIT) family protein
MYNHTNDNYVCPLCLTAQGIENEHTMALQDDIFYKDELVFAMVNSKFVGNNPGHVIVVPLKHYENIYDLDENIGHRIFDVAKKIAIALKKIRKCDGVMTLQNNEPASGQHALHFHFHIFPRFTGDELGKNLSNARVATNDERRTYSQPLRLYFEYGSSK